MISGFPNPTLATGRQKRTETQAGFHTPSDHERKWANRAMQLIPVPAGLSSRFLLSQEVAPKAGGDT
jgi:hypothetical protein